MAFGLERYLHALAAVGRFGGFYGFGATVIINHVAGEFVARFP